MSSLFSQWSIHKKKKKTLIVSTLLTPRQIFHRMNYCTARRHNLLVQFAVNKMRRLTSPPYATLLKMNEDRESILPYSLSHHTWLIRYSLHFLSPLRFHTTWVFCNVRARIPTLIFWVEKYAMTQTDPLLLSHTHIRIQTIFTWKTVYLK